MDPGEDVILDVLAILKPAIHVQYALSVTLFSWAESIIHIPASQAASLVQFRTWKASLKMEKVRLGDMDLLTNKTKH